MLRNDRPGKRKRHRRGATTVEFAVTLPILLLMFFSALEFGWMQSVRHTVNNAAYEGARRGVVPGVTEQQIRESADRVLDVIGARNRTVGVGQTEDFVTVTVTVPFRDQAWFSPLYFGRVDMRSTITLTKDKL